MDFCALRVIGVHELAFTYDATGRKNGQQFIHIAAISRWTPFLICAFRRDQVANFRMIVNASGARTVEHTA